MSPFFIHLKAQQTGTAPDVTVFNALIGSMLFVILKNPSSVEKVRMKLGKTLSKFKVCKFCFSV
jgi:hypothetical protein